VKKKKKKKKKKTKKHKVWVVKIGVGGCGCKIVQGNLNYNLAEGYEKNSYSNSKLTNHASKKCFWN